MKALLQVPWVDRSWDATALSAYLRLGYVPPASTAYRGIRKLPPGTTEIWAWDPQSRELERVVLPGVLGAARRRDEPGAVVRRGRSQGSGSASGRACASD